LSLTSNVAKGFLLGALIISPAAAQVPGAAGASAEDPIEQLADRGLRLFQASDFKGAVKAYREAYQFEPVGALLYNIAFIYDKKLNDPQLALDYYRRFVNAPDADRDTRLAAFERIVEITEELAEKTPVPPPITTPPPPPPDDSQRLIGWIVAGSGAGIAVLGGVFGILASQTHSDFEASGDAVERRDLRDTGETQALVADVGLGLGAAAIIAGLVLVFTADDAPAAAEATGVRVGPSDSGLGLSIGGSF
jgi:tetratricopeptide (TPR) repeat protein